MKDCEANGMKAEKCPAKLTTRRAEVWPTARGEYWIPARRPLINASRTNEERISECFA
jgi:hypothetical protein